MAKCLECSSSSGLQNRRSLSACSTVLSSMEVSQLPCSERNTLRVFGDEYERHQLADYSFPAAHNTQLGGRTHMYLQNHGKS